MAEVLDGKLVKVGKVKIPDLKKYHLIGFGSGIYFSRHDNDLFNLIDKLPPQKNKKAFIFSTSGAKKLAVFYEFHNPLKKRLINKGFQVAGEFNCPGFDTYPLYVKPMGGINKGRPNKEDLQKAKDFAQSLK